MENATSIQIKNFLKKILTTRKSDTLSVQEWTAKHYASNDPRISFLEGRIAALEAGVDAMAVKSIRSARFKIIQTLVKPGENVVTFNSWGLSKEDYALYKRIGVEIRLAEDGNIQTFRSLIDSNTKLIYAETISEHFITVPDFIKINSHAQLLKIPVVVDNTASIGGYFVMPIKFKANLVIEGLTEFLPEKTFYKAVIIDGGNYDWFTRFPHLLENNSFINIGASRKANPEELKKLHFIDLLRQKSTDKNNGYPIPNDPFQLIKRIEGIAPKLQEKSDNALLLARYLKNNKFVKEVNYTGLPNGKGYFQSLSFFRNGFGNILGFTLNVPSDVAQFFFNELQKSITPGKLEIERINHQAGNIKVPEGNFEDLKKGFDTTFNKLRDLLQLRAKTSHTTFAR